MRFFLRFSLVLAVAFFLGFSLYFVIQALPEDIPGLSRGNENNRPQPSGQQVNQSAPIPNENRPERDDNNRISISRLILGVGKNFVFISIICCFTIIGNRILNNKPVITIFKK